MTRRLKAINTKAQYLYYYKNKLEFFFNINDNVIELPMINDQDEMLNRLSTVTDATPEQVRQQPRPKRYTNWGAEQRHQRRQRELRAQADVNAQNRINAVEAYKKYAKSRGFSQQRIDMTIKQMVDD